MNLETLAGGRKLPPLLFVTTIEGLAQFGVGERELRALLGPSHHLAIVAPERTPEAAARALWEDAEIVRQASRFGGVVLLGGYDTLPARVIGSIDAELYTRLCRSGNLNDDEDLYHAWNDDHFADPNGDGFPELPVSRISAGCDLARALRATAPPDAAARPLRLGIRIERFRYAESIYDRWGVTSSDPMLVLDRGAEAEIAARGLTADHLYLAMHGHPHDRSFFKPFGTRERVTLAHVPAAADGMIVFAGVCWSAQIARRAPLEVVASPGGAITSHTPRDAIPLAFIDRGARAFIGFNAKHWVPLLEPYDYYGAPLHRLFWSNLFDRACPPARALFEARLAYIAGAPYRHPSRMAKGGASDRSIAKNMKDFWSVSCLGLGW